jgi:glutaconate CoA-transferase, subunit B
MSKANTQTVHPADMEAVVLARKIRDGETVFVGVNSPVPMAAALMAKAIHAPSATLITIAGGINPTPVQHSAATSSPMFAAGSASVLDNLSFYDLVGRGGIDLTFLGGAQIDRRGNINSSFLGSPRQPKVRFPGGGGGAYILPLAKRVVIWRANHDRRIFVDACDFVTAAGNLESVVTPLCVFERVGHELVVGSIHPGASADQVRDNTGFALASGTWDATPAPTAEELAALTAADPTGIRYSEFTS